MLGMGQDDAASDSNPTRRRIAYVAMGLMAGCCAVSVLALLLWKDIEWAWVALGPALWTVLLWLYARKQ
jgi:hypothetical protein